MKLKYYLRGLGIGVLVTAIILHFILGSSEPMTDEQIKLKAKELGMTDSLTLSEAKELRDSTSDNNVDISPSPSVKPKTSPIVSINEVESASPEVMPSDTPSVTASPTVQPSPSEKPSPSEIPSPSEKPSPSEIPSPSEKPSPSEIPSPSVKPTESPTDSNVREISITVASGDGSYAVAKKVQAAGLVDSAAKFDEYLCNNGYDKILTTGTHKIKENSTYEEIAKTLCGRR